MMDNETPEQTRERMKREYPLLYPITLVILVVAVLLLGGMVVVSRVGQQWSYAINLFTSVISTIVTVGIIEVFNRRREKREAAEHEELNRRRDAKNAEEVLKRQLVDDAASISNEIAKNAVHQINRKGWLRGEHGLLKGADLGGANLHSAELFMANLEGTFLSEADLQDTNLAGANLQNADLSRVRLQKALLMDANLQGAHLRHAQLQHAYLSGAEMQKADLEFADLEDAALGGAKFYGANLQWANLQGAILRFCKYDESTILPDGNYWTPQTEMQRFTSPAHPDFKRWTHKEWVEEGFNTLLKEMEENDP